MFLKLLLASVVLIWFKLSVLRKKAKKNLTILKKMYSLQKYNYTLGQIGCILKSNKYINALKNSLCFCFICQLVDSNQFDSCIRKEGIGKKCSVLSLASGYW